MTEQLHSDWFGSVKVGGATAWSRAAFARLEQLLDDLQPVAIARDRSTVTLGEELQILIHHATDPRAWIDLSYDADAGAILYLLGIEEYERDDTDPSSGLEAEALADLALILTSTYTVEETHWRRRLLRTITRGEALGGGEGVAASGWLLPPRWLLPDRHLTTRERTISYGGRRPTSTVR